MSLLTPLELTIDLTDEQFFQLCQKNRALKFERTASGVLVIISSTEGEAGRRTKH